MKKRILYIATVAHNRNRLDGETIKGRLLEDFLKDQSEIVVKTIDTDNWKKHILKLTILILFNYLWCDKIVISAADRGAHIVIDFFDKLPIKKDIYYFVIGGTLAKNINTKKWNKKPYQNIKEIYVEAKLLKDDLNKLSISNVTILNNFRKVKTFNNNYLKSDEVKFVFFSRVIKEKGIEEAISLIKKINNIDKIKCSLDIYGQVKDEYLLKLKKTFDQNIHYCGEIKPNNKTEYEILSNYDIFILPTEYPGECLPGALIDAYISGLAVIVSNWKYAEEYVKNNYNGIIFEYKDYEDMYLKTKKMLNKNFIIEYKNNSKKLSEKFLIETVLNEFKLKIVN